MAKNLTTNPKFINITSTAAELMILSQCEYLSGRERDGEFSVTNKQWGQWVRTSVSTVVRIFNKFEKLGYIKSRLAPFNGMPNAKYITFCPDVVYQAAGMKGGKI